MKSTPSSTSPAPARRLEEIARGRAGCFPITPTLIQPEPGFNGREDMGDLEALAADIEANGLQQPLKIRKEVGTENIYLIDGHRRWTAITTILIPQGRWPRDEKDETLPYPVECTSEKRSTKPVDRLFMQISMNTGKPFTFLEEARLYKRILALSPELIPAEIARRTGKTKQAISDSLRLVNEGSQSLLSFVKNEAMAASTALRIIKQAGPEHSAQDELVRLAFTAACKADRTHIMPKDIPQPEDKTPPAPQPTEEENESAPPQSQYTPPEESTQPSSDPGPTSSTEDVPPPAETAPPTVKPRFTLYIISDAPEDADKDGHYHETERLALENPPVGIERLHLLSALDENGEACYGYRFNGVTILPDPNETSSYGTNAEEGLPATLRLITAFASVFSADNPELEESIEDALHDALCRYYPEKGNPEEPQQLAFVSPPEAKEQEPSGYQKILDAPSTNRDGSGPGSGGSGFVSPEAGMKSVNKVLEEIGDKGIEERVTAVELAMSICNGESTPGSLKSYLLGK